KAGKTAEFVSKFEEILQNTQADAYIAGCTEIPIFLPLIKSNKVFIDPTLELAKAVVKFAKS
ncbi:MAG: aspartate/glutamate racemase family protein, partial [Campylobacter sp.]|nr:aspartate/glutamate racemase family protein [Campylobacter sp.]